MGTTTFVKQMSIIGYIKEQILPKINHWEEDIKKTKSKMRKVKEEKERPRLVSDLINSMKDTVNDFQVTLGCNQTDVRNDILKCSSVSVSEDIQNKMPEWRKCVQAIIKPPGKGREFKDIEQMLHTFQYQLHLWMEKLVRISSNNQQTTQQMGQHSENNTTIGEQHPIVQQPTQRSSDIPLNSTPVGGDSILKEKNKKLEKEVLDLQMKFDSKVAENLQKNENENLLKAKIDHLREEIREQARKIQAKEREKDELLNRLSAVAGRRLRDNNPAIADLSCETRPTKIAEQFKELYDNQWTDAFEELKNQGYPDETAIQILITTLEESFQFTAEMAEKRLEQLEDCTCTLRVPKDYKDEMVRQNNKAKTISAGHTTNPENKMDQKCAESTELSAECSDLIIQLRKSSAQALVEGVQKGFINTRVMKKPPQMKKEAMINYYKECTKVTWYMSIQTPPLSFAPKPAKGRNLDTDLYTQYTQSGTKVDYVVWPACLLHKGGPLLAKGVIQPFKQNGAEPSKGKASPNEIDATKSQSGNAGKTINGNGPSDDKEVSTHM